MVVEEMGLVESLVEVFGADNVYVISDENEGYEDDDVFTDYDDPWDDEYDEYDEYDPEDE